MEHKFDYNWTLKDANFTKDKGKVFSCFACGGGSTMGYKLAGFDVIGCNEIDPVINEVYCSNHHPIHNYCCDIREMVKLAENNQLPKELYNLDILDGSPPCSTFSMMGNREEDWGKKRKFREGQAEQVLDTLFFDFIDLASALQPKIVVAENVKGLVQGSAIDYVRRIYHAFDNAGYVVKHWLLNSKDMGVPQMRERVFFIAVRSDLDKCIVNDGLFDLQPNIDMMFKEHGIPFGDIRSDLGGGKELSEYKKMLWENKQVGDLDCGDVTKRLYGKEKCFTDSFVFNDKVLKTINTSCLDLFMLWDVPRRLNNIEIILASSFPLDYDFGEETPVYICGMSVPPVMMAQIASRIYDNLLSKE
jgi:DNA (cytosine-5)-methyltransferase 1